MNKTRCTGLIFAVIFAVAFIMPGFVSAQDKVIELKYGSTYGPDHSFSIVDKKWIDKIEKETKGRVKIKPYWNGTLYSGKDGGVDELISNVVDIAMINPSYAKSGFGICRALYLFTYGANQETGRRILKDLRAKFPEIDAEYKGVKVMAYTSGVDYDLITRKPVHKIADLKGMRIKITADFAPVFKELGAEGVNAPMPEAYPMIQKGILDGLMGSKEGLKSLRLAEVAKYYTYIGLYRTHNGSRAMNMDVYNKLPADIRKVFDDNIDWWGLENDKQFEDAHQAGIEFGKQQKVEFITFPKEELAKFYSAFTGTASGLAKDLDAKGLPGTKILQEAQNLVKKYNK
jgi:TRAP-type C4-dicarboxylate transport system substrate-binding protein